MASRSTFKIGHLQWSASMFRTPASSLPHPHLDQPEPHENDLDAEARFRRLVAQIEDIGRRNDEMRQRIASNLQLVDRLIAAGDR